MFVPLSLFPHTTHMGLSFSSGFSSFSFRAFGSMRVESAYVRKTSNVRARRLRALTLQAPFSGIRLYPDGLPSHDRLIGNPPQHLIAQASCLNLLDRLTRTGINGRPGPVAIHGHGLQFVERVVAPSILVNVYLTLAHRVPVIGRIGRRRG